MLKFTLHKPTVPTVPTLKEFLENDVFAGTPMPDNYSGGVGNDIMKGSAAADHFDGGTGTDTVDYSASQSGVSVNLTLGKGSFGDAQGDTFEFVENIVGSAHRDVLIGDAGDNWIAGLDGNDYLAGRAGDDSLIGGEGDDFLDGGSGADLLSGGSGVDTVSYTASSAGVIVDLTAGTGQGGDADGDTLYGIENILGSSHNDELTGNCEDNVIRGGQGDDILSSKGGADVFVFSNDDFLPHGDDLIMDFLISENDRLDLSGTQITSFSQLTAGRMIQSGMDTVIYTEASGVSGDSIRLANVDMGTLDAGDFIF